MRNTLVNRVQIKIRLWGEELLFLKSFGLKYWPIRKFKQIDGFLSDKEAIELFTISRNVYATAQSVVVEIGSWQGKSTLCIAKGLKIRDDGSKLYCIDPFNATGHPIYEKIFQNTNQLKSLFTRNMKNNGVLNLISVLEGYSFNFVSSFNEKIDFLFIDGNHDYDAVLKDYSDWSPYIKPQGVIAFHDVEFDPASEPTGKEEFPGPGLVIKHKIINNPEWHDCKRVDNLFYAVKRG